MKKKLLRVILILVLILVLVFTLVVMPLITVHIYKMNFDQRFGSYKWDTSVVLQYDGLQMEECYFQSNLGQTLAGAKYSREMDAPKGVIVMAHGFGGGGHTGYLKYVDYFTANGYLVFAYDATGNDKSEGDVVGGLPQGVIDLDYALDYVANLPEYDGLPVALFGHSWGAYSVGSVLNVHPEVRAVVMEAGFNASMDMIEQEGRLIAEDYVKLLLPYVRVYEWIKYGKYAGFSALEGFENSDAGVMILHGGLDRTVLAENGYDKFYEAYGDSDRFEFLWFENGGHNNLSSIGSRVKPEIAAQMISFFDFWCK